MHLHKRYAMKMAKYCQDEVELFRLKLRVRSWLHSKGKLNPQRCLAEWLHHSQGSGSCFPGEREAEWGQSGCRGPPVGMARGCRNPESFQVGTGSHMPAGCAARWCSVPPQVRIVCSLRRSVINGVKNNSQGMRVTNTEHSLGVCVQM